MFAAGPVGRKVLKSEKLGRRAASLARPLVRRSAAFYQSSSLSYCFFSLCKFVSFHLYLLAFSFLNAIFSLQIFVAFFPSQVQECSNCMKSQFVKRQRNNYQQLGIAEKMEQRIQLKSFRWLCSSDQGKHNPLFDKMTKYSPLFIQKISLTISWLYHWHRVGTDNSSQIVKIICQKIIGLGILPKVTGLGGSTVWVQGPVGRSPVAFSGNLNRALRSASSLHQTCSCAVV